MMASTTMKQTKIDLLEPFEKVLELLLSLPESNKGIAEAVAKMPQVRFANGVNHDPTGKAQLEDVLRCIHEAAQGTQGATEARVTISPTVAASLREPFYVRTQAAFLLEALTRIISGALHSHAAKVPPQIDSRPALDNMFNTPRSRMPSIQPVTIST